MRRHPCKSIASVGVTAVIVSNNDPTDLLPSGFVQARLVWEILKSEKIISESVNCQGILKILEKVSENWKNLIKVSEFGKHKLWSIPA